MPTPNLSPSEFDHYWLTNAHIPVALLSQVNAEIAARQTREGLVCANLEIRDGTIAQILSVETPFPETLPEPMNAIDVRRGIVFPCFVDLHTHLDKGHIWERSPNLEGTFDRALAIVQADCKERWNGEDVYRRMEFGLKCSYAHGTKAIRTHIDSFGEQAAISFGAFKTLQTEWTDRLILQAASLVSLDYFLTPDGEKLADLVAEVDGILGGIAYMNDELEIQLDRVFTLAKERNLNLDFHTDESGNPNDITLRHVAMAAIRHQFSGQIVCGHCCSLGMQSAEEVMTTMEWVKQARIGIVSLPMCNLYLQDRDQQVSRYFTPSPHPSIPPSPQTPRWRGVTLAHELKQFGIPIAFASDNCRDPFHAFGDHDGLEVFTQATRIVQLDSPYGEWCRSVTTTSADLMELSTVGRIGIGLPADLVIFRARYFSELLSRHQHDRVVLRDGKAIDTTLPDYAELDDLLIMGNGEWVKSFHL
ncbi:MAG: cytosine deaminase [Cyanobacteria bacterium CRU_2_1]|nr:cytosine deaminase [Cyanobacteria bacterium RU_5_0]NJR60429.1 cytosine deaminase [Cyanobacteria bacterium CRU_2_1]